MLTVFLLIFVKNNKNVLNYIFLNNYENTNFVKNNAYNRDILYVVSITKLSLILYKIFIIEKLKCVCVFEFIVGDKDRTYCELNFEIKV